MLEPLANLKKFFSDFFEVPPLEWLYLARLLKVQNLKKDDFYFRQGDPVKEISFVAKGLIVNFYTSDAGEDFIKYFVQEKTFVGCYSSLLLGVPASFSSQALEPSTLVTLQYKDLESLYRRHPCWERMGRIIAEKLYVEKEKREQYFLMADAKARYEGFLKDSPGLAQRVPQYLIASYIGISPVSLSRIRKSDTAQSYNTL